MARHKNSADSTVLAGDFSIESGYKQMKDAISKLGDELPTAFFVESDTMAIGAIKALQENNIAIAGAALAACENIYELEKKARKKHTQRMKDGECEISAGVVYMDLIQHFTRICEHARNVLEKEIQGNL